MSKCYPSIYPVINEEEKKHDNECEQRWSCGTCTYFNDQLRLCCEMCGVSRRGRRYDYDVEPCSTCKGDGPYRKGHVGHCTNLCSICTDNLRSDKHNKTHGHTGRHRTRPIRNPEKRLVRKDVMATRKDKKAKRIFNEEKRTLLLLEKMDGISLPILSGLQTENGDMFCTFDLSIKVRMDRVNEHRLFQSALEKGIESLPGSDNVGREENQHDNGTCAT